MRTGVKTVVIRQEDVQVAIKLWLECRSEFGRREGKESKNEDSWMNEQMCEYRSLLADKTGCQEYRTADTLALNRDLNRFRKNKLNPRKKKPNTFANRIWKLTRDFRKSQKRRGLDYQSDEYQQYILSSEWMDRARDHRKECNWRCQVCGRTNTKTEVHHTAEGYRHLGHEDAVHLINACKEPCHPILDLLRECGGSRELLDQLVNS